MGRIQQILVAGMVLAAGAGWAVTLEECERAALEGNPGLAAAQQRVVAARWAYDQAAAAYYPMIGTKADYLVTDNPTMAFMNVLNQRSFTMDSDFNNPDTTDNLRLEINARIRLFDGGRRGLDRGMAASQRDAVAAREQAVRNELIYQVRKTYHGVLQARAFVQVGEETVTSYEESLRVARARNEAGSAVRTDVLNLDVQLAQAREDLIRARNRLKLAVAALNTSIGRPLAEADAVEEQGGGLKAPPAEELNWAAHRPELEAMNQAVRAGEQAATKARRDKVPSISAYGAVDWDSDLSNSFEDSYFAGVVAEWDAFTGFQRSRAADQAQAEWQATREEARALEDHLRFDLKQAHLAAEDAWERLDVARKSMESAEEALRITGERYEQGVAEITELLTAQVGRTATRSRQVAAHYEYLTALANLERARGGEPIL